MDLIDYVPPLRAEQTDENAVPATLRAGAARSTDTAALFQAIGGGRWNSNDIPLQPLTPFGYCLRRIEMSRFAPNRNFGRRRLGSGGGRAYSLYGRARLVD